LPAIGHLIAAPHRGYDGICSGASALWPLRSRPGFLSRRSALLNGFERETSDA